MGKLTENKIMQVLDYAYDKSLTGLPGLKSCYELAEEYLKKYKTPEEAVKHFINMQTVKCGTSGFLTGLGGLLTLPVTLPANLTSVLYIQLLMISTIAVIGGQEPKDDEVRTLAYACLLGSGVTDVLKQTGIQIGNKATIAALKKLPGEVLTKINQRVGFRLLTKFGEKGTINLVKIVPVVGGIIGGSIDIVSTKVIARTSKDVFLVNGEMTCGD